MRNLIGSTLALLLAACGDSGGDGPPPVPDQIVHCAWLDGTCSQASKPTFSEAERTTGAADCATATGTWGDGPCDTSAVVAGYCFYNDFQAETGIAIADLTLRDYYAAASWDGTTAPADCTTAGGSWATGAGAGTIAESESNGVMGTADPLPLGGSAAGNTASISDPDYYVIVVPQGGRDVRFRTFDASGAGCVSIDPFVEVRDSAGLLVVSFDDLGNSRCEDWWVSLPAGSYYVVVRGFVAGNYVLTTSATGMSSARPMTLSCFHAPEGGCLQYSGSLSAADTTNVSADCGAEGGAYSAGSCTTSGAVAGHCEGISVSFGDHVAISGHFYAPNWTAASAQSFCTGSLGGTWVP